MATKKWLPQNKRRTSADHDFGKDGPPQGQRHSSCATNSTRAAYRNAFQPPKNLEDVLRQEGTAMRFAGYELDLDNEDIDYSREVIEPLRLSTDYSVWFRAFYGDTIGRSAGYSPLGLSDFAGLNVALTDAIGSDPLEALQR